MKWTLTLWVVMAFATIVAGQSQPGMKFEHGLLQVINLPSINASSTKFISDDQWRAILQVYTHDAYLRNIDQSIAGKYEWDGSKIFFRPTYAFSPGEIYHAVFTPEIFLRNAGLRNEGLLQKSELSFSIPTDIHPLTAIEAIYPESIFLPENILRMYIYFSAPMMPGEAYEHISLTMEDGTKVEKAFLVVDQELWDAERKRFTLLFDPGRIKRGLKSNLDLGTPIRKGEQYRLVIDSAWRDVHGNPLERTVYKTFSVSGAERSKVSSRHWKVTTPHAGTRGDVVISFDRPMDHALALKYITIKNLSGVVAGSSQIINDIVWKFTPRHPWMQGEHVLTVSPLLEDVAGNNLNNAFDLDVAKESRVYSVEPVELQLTVRGIDH
jgi:hypothetical protein